MAPKHSFQCTACKETFVKWSGQCLKCKTWNSLVDYDAPLTISTSSTAKGYRASKNATGNTARPVSQIGKEIKGHQRLKTDIGEFDRVLGGGLVAGGVILLAGDPGVGKSSVALAVASAIANQGKKVLYITGEETAEQVASRAVRIGAADGETKLGETLYLLAEGNLQNALQQTVDLQPEFLVVDSVQTLLSNDSESRVGSITQVSEVATDFNNLAKKMGIPTILIGHVTKAGDIAGPRVVEHLVDVVLFFESNSESSLRLLRGIKNRYGATDEIGCFMHTSEGLVPVEDPSGYFTSPHAPGTTGFATAITLEGVRALPIELQALVAKTKLPNPRKITSGLEHGRALQMQAVLDRYIGSSLDTHDVYVSTTGGLRVKDASTDLAVVAAIVSSLYNLAIPTDTVFIGEVSLTGEIRAAKERNKRIMEAARLGFTTIYTTPDNNKKLNVKANIIEFDTIVGMFTHLKERLQQNRN